MENTMTYTKNGDYFIPNMTLSQSEEKSLGKYGRMRKAYLKEHRPVLWNSMILSESLYPHLREIDETANRRMEQMMSDRKQTIADCELARKCLTDFSTLDAEIERQLAETQVIAEMVKAAVKENASTAQSQEAYLKKYEALTERYEKAAAELERLQAERTARTQQDKKIALFIRTFKKLPDTMTEWDDTIWTVMVEKAIVHKDGGVTFVFKNGAEIKVGF